MNQSYEVRLVDIDTGGYLEPSRSEKYFRLSTLPKLGSERMYVKSGESIVYMVVGVREIGGERYEVSLQQLE